MRFDVVTIFPDFFSGPLDYGIVRRAREAGLIEVALHDLREFTHDRHRTVDDRPFGGGEGMVLKPEPLFEAVESLLGRPTAGPGAAVVLLSASGKVFRQDVARRFSKLERLILLCGRYEGVDERVAEHLASEEIAIGDFVLSGGELAAMMVLDAVTRLLPGALGNEGSAVNESFSAAASEQSSAAGHRAPESDAAAQAFRKAGADLGPGISGVLDCPHYTRPQVFRDWEVPGVLVTGNHEQIRRWRRQMALQKTMRNRPDLLDSTSLTEEDRRLLHQVRNRSKPRR
jgi:tRNA (guanine37-N1)-methyltransferase